MMNITRKKRKKMREFFSSNAFFLPSILFFSARFFFGRRKFVVQKWPFVGRGPNGEFAFFSKKNAPNPLRTGENTFQHQRTPPGTLNFVLEAFLKIRKNRTFWDFPGFPCKLTFEPFLAQFLGVSQKALGSIVGVFRRALEPNSPPKRSFAARCSFSCV
jgi:hypothetical protein